MQEPLSGKCVNRRIALQRVAQVAAVIGLPGAAFAQGKTLRIGAT